MSNQWMNLVWQSNKHKGTARLVMLALADHANEEGVCWPSVERIADKANISKRHAIRVLAELEADGSLSIQRGEGRKHTSVYQIKGDIVVSPLCEEKTDTTMSPFQTHKGDISHRKGDIFDTNSDIAMSPEPLIEPPIETKAAEPPAFLREDDSDKDGRFTMQLIADQNLFGLFGSDAKKRAASLEATYRKEDIRRAVGVMVKRHMAMVNRGEQGVRDAVSFLAKILHDEFKTAEDKRLVKVEVRMAPSEFYPNGHTVYDKMSLASARQSGFKIVEYLQ